MKTSPRDSERILRCIDHIPDRTIQRTALATLWLHCGEQQPELQEQLNQKQIAVSCELEMEKIVGKSSLLALDDLMMNTLEQVEELNEENEQKLKWVVERLAAGRRMGENHDDVEIALLHHVLCLSEDHMQEEISETSVL